MTLGKAVFGRNKKGDFFQLEKGGEDFFSEKIRGAKTFFRLKKKPHKTPAGHSYMHTVLIDFHIFLPISSQ